MDTKKFEKYMEKYGSAYSENARKFIGENYSNGLRYNIQMPDIINQIYSYLGELPDNKNIYIKILQMIEYYFTLNKDILEIGCGFFPELTRRIDLKQQELGVGSIKAFDENLVTTELGNIRLYKENYTSQNIPYNLLLGFMPCEATELIIDKSAKDHKEYFLGMCGCAHIYFPFPVGDASKIYRDYIINKAESSLDSNATLDIEYIEGYNYPYPILIKRYNKNVN